MNNKEQIKDEQELQNLLNKRIDKQENILRSTRGYDTAANAADRVNQLNRALRSSNDFEEHLKQQEDDSSD